jgi:hypothetical protein
MSAHLEWRYGRVANAWDKLSNDGCICACFRYNFYSVIPKYPHDVYSVTVLYQIIFHKLTKHKQKLRKRNIAVK